MIRTPNAHVWGVPICAPPPVVLRGLFVLPLAAGLAVGGGGKQCPRAAAWRPRRHRGGSAGGDTGAAEASAGAAGLVAAAVTAQSRGGNKGAAVTAVTGDGGGGRCGGGRCGDGRCGDGDDRCGDGGGGRCGDRGGRRCGGGSGRSVRGNSSGSDRGGPAAGPPVAGRKPPHAPRNPSQLREFGATPFAGGDGRARLAQRVWGVRPLHRRPPRAPLSCGAARGCRAPQPRSARRLLRAAGGDAVGAPPSGSPLPSGRGD